MKVNSYALACFVVDPKNPKKDYPEDYVQALADNLRRRKQQTPIHSFLLPDGKRQVIKGHTRLRAAPLAGLTELATVEWDHIPSASELCSVQLSLDNLQRHLSMWERCDKFREWRESSTITVAQMAGETGFKQGTVSKYLALGNLASEPRALLQSGGCDLEKAYLISQEPDPLRQLTLAEQVTKLSRPQLQALLKPKALHTVKPRRYEFQLDAQTRICVEGLDLDVKQTASQLQYLLRVLKSSQAENLSLDTIIRMLSDKVNQQAAKPQQPGTP